MSKWFFACQYLSGKMAGGMVALSFRLPAAPQRLQPLRALEETAPSTKAIVFEVLRAREAQKLNLKSKPYQVRSGPPPQRPFMRWAWSCHHLFITANEPGQEVRAFHGRLRRREEEKKCTPNVEPTKFALHAHQPLPGPPAFGATQAMAHSHGALRRNMHARTKVT